MRVTGAVIAMSAAAFCLAPSPAGAQAATAETAFPDGGERPTDTQVLMDWVYASRDNNGRPYMVIDKRAAQLFVFDSQNQLIGTTAVLIGSAKGDTSAPGIGERELRHIPRDQRTTPAGRFVASYGRAAGRKQVLWVDWATAVSLHPVVTSNKRERRLQRLASPTPDDNRITFGCINVEPAFYRNIVAPLFGSSEGIVYILPEELALKDVFWSPPQVTSSGDHE
jgi:hypothetical protein